MVREILHYSLRFSLSFIRLLALYMSFFFFGYVNVLTPSFCVVRKESECPFFFLPSVKNWILCPFFKQEEQSDEIYGVPPFSKLYDVQNL
jgi:hypothetical protein